MNSENKYDWIGEFHQGVAIVKKDGKYGAMMVGGKEIVPPIYDSLTEFTDSLAKVEYKGEERIVNLSGQIQVKKDNDFVFIPEKYDWGCDYSGGVCMVEKSGKYGLLSDGLVELIAPLFDTITKINNESYLAIGKQNSILIDIEHQLHYNVRDCIFNEKGVFKGAVVSLPEKNNLLGIINDLLRLVLPIENESIVIENNKFFVVQRNGKGVGLCSLNGELIPMGIYDNIYVLNDFFILGENVDSKDFHITKSTLLNTKGECLVPNFEHRSFSVKNNGYIAFDHFKISPNGEVYYILSRKNPTNYLWEEIGNYLVTTDFISYKYIEPFNDNHFVVGQVDENGYLRFGVVDSKGLVILPFEYSRLKVLSNDYIAYSTDSENILDLKKDYNDKDLEWLLYHTDYGRFGEKLNVLHLGIINSEYKMICPPKYRSIKVVETSSSCFFQVSVDGYKWGIIDDKDIVVLPIKFNSVDFTNKKYIYDPIHEYNAIKVEKLLGVVSNGPSWDSQRKQNRFDETGSFIVPLKDGKMLSVSSTAYDWCDSFNDKGWAIVTKSGLSGKINIKGEVISLFDEHLIVVPDFFDWAYDFSFGYAPVCKDGRWGIADKDWTLVIPCIYESIEPICEGFFKYKETANDVLPDNNKGNEGAQPLHIKIPQFKYGIVNIGNIEIIKADYKNIWPIEGGFFKIERVVDNTVRDYDRYGIINNNGDLVIAPNYAVISFVRIDGKEFWIVTQNRKRGVLHAGKPLILNIFDDIIVEDGIFVCKANSYSKDKGTFVKYNVNGEILIDCMSQHYNVSAEYDVAYHSDYGLVRVVKEGKWGLINLRNDVVVPPSFSYIDTFDGQFAKVGKTEDDENINFPDDIGRHNKNMKYGLIDCLGDIVLPLEYDNIIKWEDEYYVASKNNNDILFSPNLYPIFESNNWLKKLDDRFILKVDSSGWHGYRYGLIDYNGNEIIPMDEEHCFSEIEVLKNDFLKVTYYKGEYGTSHIAILNNRGKTIFERTYYCDDITLLDNGYFLVRRDNYGSRTTYSLANLQGKEILSDSYYEIKLVNDGMVSIQNHEGWGLADIKGNIIIAPNYLDELVFEDGVANIKVKGSSSIQKINKKGNVIVHNGKNEIELPQRVYWGTDFVNKVSIVRGKGRGYDVIGVADIKGNIIIPTLYKSISLLSNKTIRVQDGDCYGIFDLKGNIIFPPIFTSMKYISEDRIKVTWNLTIVSQWDRKDYTPASNSKYKGYSNEYEINNRSAICNSKAEIVNDKEIAVVGKFINGYARAYKEVMIEKGRVQLKQAGIINVSGKTIIPLIYDGIIIYDNSPYIRLRKNGKYGIANLTSGKVKMFNKLDIKHMWDVDKMGRCIYSEDCEYDREREDWIGGTRGVLSLKGIIVPAGKYRDIDLLGNGLIKVSNENLYGLLDKEGNEILQMNYSYISSFKGNLATICINGKREDEWPYKIRGGKWGVIDCTGKFVKECVSDDEEFLEEKEYDYKKQDNTEQFEKPSVVLSDIIPEPKERNSYDYGYDSYYDDDDDGGQYSKYGGYNGWDDNTIDEAFDGNPELTWNID